MLTFKRLITFVIPSSILGLSWFWWRWKNKSLLKDNNMDTHNDTTTKVNVESDSNNQGELNETNIESNIEIHLSDEIITDKCIENASVDNIENTHSSTEDLENNIKSLDIDLLVAPCVQEINNKNEEDTVENSDVLETCVNVKDNGCSLSAVIEDEISILLVDDVECGNTSSENPMSPHIPNERSHSIISQLSVDCVQEDIGSDEFSPIQYTSSNGKRIRNQSSCGDSAIVEDYSSDALSITGSDSAIKSSEGEACSVESQPITEEQCFKKGIYPQDNGRSYRDWYGPGIGSSDFKEKPEKSRHWGSLPVSDSDSDSECILKRTAKIGSVSLDKLSIQLNEELSKMKSPERNNSSKPNRYPKQNRRRNRKSESKTPKKTPASKPSPQPKKNDSNRRQRKKSNCGSPKKDIDKPWRNHESPRKCEKFCTDENVKRVTVEYEFPDDMCGRLIGKSGRHISEFKESTGVDICIECELHGKNRIVSMTGVFTQIQSAERQLNEKFHDSLKLLNFPDLAEVEKNFTVVALPENTEFNVVVTAIIDAGSFYVQLCNRDVEEKLIQLQSDLYGCYASPRQKYVYKDKDFPQVDEHCVSFIDNVWCRLKVLSVYPETRMVDVFFIDYGGNVNLSIDFIWRTRSDLLQLPAQAVLCRLNNAIPVVGATEFSYEANELFYQLVGAKALQAYLSCVKDDIPYVLLSYFDEERGEMFSVLEQMQLWGLVQDQSIPPQFVEQLLNEDMTHLSEPIPDEYVLPLQDESTPFVETLLNIGAQQFICAS